MNTTTADALTYGKAIDRGSTGKEDFLFDRIVEVDAPEDSLFFSIVDFCMVLLVYLGPVAAFACLVAPVVARLLSMPVPA